MRGSIVCRQCGKGLKGCQCRGKRALAVAVYLGKNPDTGKKEYKWVSGFRTVKEAQAHQLQVATSPAYGSGLGPHGSTKQRVGAEMLRWIDRREVKDHERACLRSRFRVHIEPVLGGVPLSRTAPATIQGLLDGLTGINRTMRLKVFQDVQMFFDYALSMGWVNANPCDTLKRPKRERFTSPIAHWSRDHLEAFFSTCEESGDDGLLFLTTYYGGARQSEVLGLTWPHVDFEEPAITFVQDLESVVGGGKRFDNTKTINADRTVLIPVRLAERLRALRKRQVEERLARALCGKGRGCRYQHCKDWHDWDLVFCQENGKPLHGRDVTQRTFKALLRKAEVPDARFHDLKSLHNSILMRKNVNAGIIKQTGGHSSAGFTLDRYAWASLDHEEQQVAVAALESAPGLAKD